MIKIKTFDSAPKIFYILGAPILFSPCTIILYDPRYSAGEAPSQLLLVFQFVNFMRVYRGYVFYLYQRLITIVQNYPPFIPEINIYSTELSSIYTRD